MGIEQVLAAEKHEPKPSITITRRRPRRVEVVVAYRRADSRNNRNSCERVVLLVLLVLVVFASCMAEYAKQGDMFHSTVN